MKGLLAILFLAAQAQAATLYVSLTGSHDTNAPAFSTWATAATNIQAAIDAADAGDTVRVAPGTYTAAVTNNKNNLTVQGGYGTLWDADRTIIDMQGEADSRCVIFFGATNSVLRGFTVVGARPSLGSGAIYFTASSRGCLIDSCVVRSNQSAVVSTSGIRSLGNSCEVQNSIIVGNSMPYGGVSVSQYLGSDGFFTIQNCIVEANANYQAYLQGEGRITAINCVLGNASSTTHAGGNVTNNTTNSVCRVLNIAPASEGVGTNLQWAGVAAYMPRLGSLAQGAGGGYAGIDAARSGDGGPALVPAGANFLGRDSSTNANHGASIGGVTASTNSPFAGERSAAFDGASGGINAAPGNSAAITLEAWFRTTAASPNNDVGHRVVTIYRNTSFWTKFAIMLRNNKPRLLWVKSSPVAVDGLDAPSTANDGAWHHIAGTTDGTEFRLYVDGVCVATNLSSNLSSDYVGHGIGWNGGNDGYFDGEIADARAWNIARTPAEIATNYTNRLTGTEAGLVGYWRLDERGTPITTGPFNLRNPTLQPTFMEAF